jgi:Uri superfamily endonuclease
MSSRTRGSTERPSPGADRQGPPPDGGLYLLVIRLDAAVQLTVGRHGTFPLDPGLYVYVGSARRGLSKRVERHCRPEKPLRWHIDYLTTHPRATVVATAQIRYRDPREAEECRLNRAVGRWLEATTPIPGFGASDCRQGCPAHLWFMPLSRSAPDSG